MTIIDNRDKTDSQDSKDSKASTGGATHAAGGADKSRQLFARAKGSIPGGVNSPVRSFKAVGGGPVFIDRAEGAYLHSADGKRYLDMICSWGAMILGHGGAAAAEVMRRQTLRGVSFGAPTAAEIDIAEQLCARVPSLEMLRMVNSGTEATMSAIRLARGYANRHKLIKFNGCYHGHSDGLLAQAGSGVLSMSSPSSPGVPPEMVQHTINLEYNNAEQLQQAFHQHAQALAAVIIEPIAGNMNFIPADAAFLKQLRDLCTAHGVVLIFDEVMSGFRVAPGGAQELYGIIPDITCLGKVIGGGLPVGAFGGKREIMQHLAPVGEVYQAGTLAGNPMVVALGLHTLQQLDAAAYAQLEAAQQQLVAAVNETAAASGAPICAQGQGGMLGIYYGLEQPPRNLQQAAQQDAELFKRIFFALLAEGVHLPPSQFEACFISTAHQQDEIVQFTEIFAKILKKL